MHKFLAIGINLAILALIVGSLFSGKPLWTNTPQAGANPTALTLNNH